MPGRSKPRRSASSTPRIRGCIRRRARSHVEDADRGYVCTLNVVVLKGRTAHIFHIGDSRVYRVAGTAMEQLTDDHRVVLSSQQIYLGRALGMSPQVEIDYRPIQLEEGDLFLQATDGVCEHLDAARGGRRHRGQRERSRRRGQGHRGARLIGAAARTTSPSSSCGSMPCRRAMPAKAWGWGRPAVAAAARAAPAVRRLPDRARPSTAAAAATPISRSTARAARPWS